MIAKEKLKDYANKLMFDMNDEEYETLQEEFDIILKQMDLIGNIPNISSVEPMTFPFKLVQLPTQPVEMLNSQQNLPFPFI